MEKKHRFLGFLSVCVFCVFALMGNVNAADCGAGTYLDGDECIDCPPGYPESEDGATSINQCYISYVNEKCVKGTCPVNSKSCMWKTSGRVTGTDYYGQPTNKTCAISILTCINGYYQTDDKLTCNLCSEIPGYEGIYSGSGGGSVFTCYQNCTASCLHDVCPDHGVCTYEDFQIPGGVFYDGLPYDPQKCKPINNSSCRMQVECNVDVGYTTFNPETVTCDANKLIINYEANGGLNAPDATECFYDGACNAASAGDMSRTNWEFIGWNTAADGSGDSYAAGANIMNIISDGDITFYAQWNQLNTPCEVGKYYDGEAQVPCPEGSFCSGEGEAPAGQAGCATPCPGNGHSAPGASLQSQCYVECSAPAEIKNGALEQVNDKEYNDGKSDAYPVCTYHATCDTGYIAQNDNSVAPKCVWENPDDCPVGFYCPDDSDEPIACPRIQNDDTSPRGTSDKGARVVTDCYYVFAPWDSFKNGNAAGKCKYTDGTASYSACNLDRAFSCLPGYYHLTEQTVGCVGVQQGYYSDGTNDACLADNYTSPECVASLSQKPCPDKLTNPTVASAEFATSVTQCSKECVRTDPHGTVSRTKERVNADVDGVYDACEYTVTCNTGYMPADNGTENAHCVAREYNVILDKNGGAGDVADSIKCTFDSGVCDLPSSVGLTRRGHSLVARWCSNPAGTGTCYDAGTRITTNISSDGSDVTLYAVWTPNVYKITLDNNEATDVASPSVVYLKYGVAWFADAAAQNAIEQLTIVPTKIGYNFSGFFDSAKLVRVIGDNGKFLASEQVLTFTAQDVSVYAQWAAGLTECAAGTYYTGTGSVCETCPENHYCLGGKFATDTGIAGQDLCPGDGHSEQGTKSAGACYKTGQAYSATYGTGVQTCYYDTSAQTYTYKCKDQEINSCNAGYWLDVDSTAIDCSPVEGGYYSTGGGIGREPCPTEDSVKGQTNKNNATSVSECYMENRVYDLNNGGALYGTGTQTCYFNVGAAKYNDRCIRDSIQITYCNAGYWFDVTQNQYDCVPVGVDFYSEIGDIARHGCPAPRDAESGTPNTRGNTTTDSATGCFLTRELTTALHGHGRWGCFYNDNASVKDYTNCSNPEMYECDAGYYYKSSVMANDCIVVGRGNYSPALDTALHVCPDGGYTLSDTASDFSDCLKDGLVCTVSNGFGTQTCSFNGTDIYNRCDCSKGCTVCNVTECDTGYSLISNACIMCPENNVCVDGVQKTCSASTGGEYPNSDLGTTDVSRCWRECPLAADAVAMSGRDYYTGADTCEISQCRAGYALHNGECVVCPEGSFCDGKSSDDTVGKQCKTLGDGSWTLSAPGSSSASECYQECKQHDVENGVAIPVAARAYWDTQCEYRGKSLLGNECDIIDGVCMETSCANIYEMIDGRCQPCNRENALSYAADGNCVIASCVTGYHVEDGKCVANSRGCTASHAMSAHQTWDFDIGEYGICIVDECDTSYSLISNACIMCPENNVCVDGVQKTCSASTGGEYPNSDLGTTDVSRCWRECPLAADAVAMSGRDYYTGADTCEISQCRAGYVLKNGTCIACPAGSFCDGTSSGDTIGKQCKTLGDGSWALSAPGSSSASECYQECKQHDVENGVAIPVSSRAYWDTQCEYRGKSLLGNECDIIDGVCIETSCTNIYEMIDGRCRPCNRENAMSYAQDGNCIVASCIIGYHVENGKCVANSRECTALHAMSAHQTWDFKIGAYGICVIDECADGYHVASNACVSDVQVCDVENGVGKMEWNHSAHAWGNCVATSCDVGYTMDPSLTNERWKQCGQCKNKFSVRGEQAVSSYIRECEIASCLYQGELYNLENNECVPICDVNGYEDETGTMKWNATTHKCDRHCKSGYLMW